MLVNVTSSHFSDSTPSIPLIYVSGTNRSDSTELVSLMYRKRVHDRILVPILAPIESHDSDLIKHTKSIRAQMPNVLSCEWAGSSGAKGGVIIAPLARGVR
ncbi:hypothetical protein BLOT_013616 [Blomia tropicalis]|nr:hypothetical protein BLOT_013616 [Blomia tropicalis]